MGFYFELIIGLIATIGIIRFARTGSMGDAFNFGAILATMGKIGWINYILALIIMGIILRVVEGVLMAIPFIGGLIVFLLFPFFALFEARYLCQVYDSAGTRAILFFLTEFYGPIRIASRKMFSIRSPRYKNCHPGID